MSNEEKSASGGENEQEKVEQPEKKKSETKTISPTLKIILWVVGIIVIAILLLTFGYMVGDNSSKDKNDTATVTPTATLSISKTASASASATATPDPTVGWKTYSNSDYGVSFKYPNSWSDPVATLATVDGGPVPVDNTYVDFGKDLASNVSKSAELSKVSSYTGTAIEDNKNKLINVFNNKSVDGTDKLLAPSENAAVMAATTPKYIETTNSKFRGLYYFATIGQSYSTTLDAVIIMTDGNDKIIQFMFSANSVNASDYPCISSVDANCTAAKVEGDSTKFNTYVSTLTDTSSETIVKDFNSTYKYMALSLKAL